MFVPAELVEKFTVAPFATARVPSESVTGVPLVPTSITFAPGLKVVLAKVWLLEVETLPMISKVEFPKVKADEAEMMPPAGAVGGVKSSVREPLFTVVGPV